MIPFTHDGAGAVVIDGVGTIDGVLWPLGSVPIFLHSKDAIYGSARLPARVNEPLVERYACMKDDMERLSESAVLVFDMNLCLADYF